MNMLTLICARGNSKGIKNKNIKLFNKKPLIYYSIKQALRSKYIKEVFVSTDSNTIAKHAKKFGAKVEFIRSRNLSHDKTPEIAVWKDAIKKIQKIKKKKYSHICVISATSPLRQTSDIDKSIRIYRKNKIDGVLCITKSSKNPYFNMVKLSKNKIKPLMLNKKKIFTRQKAPGTFDITTIAYVMSSNFIFKTKHILDGKLAYNIIPKERSIDIDDIIDFKFAELLHKHKIK